MTVWMSDKVSQERRKLGPKSFFCHTAVNFYETFPTDWKWFLSQLKK